jgi:CSLREA domain-containing protein
MKPIHPFGAAASAGNHHRRSWPARRLFAVLALTAGFLPVAVSHAALLVVNSDDDTGNAESRSQCTLRAAIASINAGHNQQGCIASTGGDNGLYGSHDRIVFDAAAVAPAADGIIALSRGELTVTRAVAIIGPGRDRLVIVAGSVGRIFDIRSGAVQVRSLTMNSRLAPASQGDASAAAAPSGTGLLRVRLLDDRASALHSRDSGTGD